MGDESRTVRVTVAKMTRGRVGKRFKAYTLLWEFEFRENRGWLTERQRELHAAPSVVAELTPFFARALSPFFPFPPSFFPWFAGPPRGGRRRQVGEEGELPRCGERLRMEGHGWAPCPARGSEVSLEEGEGARSLRVRSYQR